MEKTTSFRPPSSVGVEIEHFVFPAALVGKPLVHVEQLAGEEGRLVAAGAGANFHDQAAAGRRVAGRGQILQLRLRGFNCSTS